MVGNRRNWHALNWETDEQIGRKRTRWRWRRLSATLPRTSRCATTALQRGSKSSTLTDRGKVRIGVTRNAMCQAIQLSVAAKEHGDNRGKV